jgi:ferrochelatase
MNTYDAVFFISFGGPEKQTDVMPFLETVTRGRGIPHERLLEVAEHYTHLGGRSPINEITRNQAQALEQALTAQEQELPVYIGQRNWHPFIEDTLRKMQKDGIRRAIGFPTAAHGCEASLERYVHAVDEARARIGAGAPAIDFVDPWFDHPLFIDAIAARVQEALTEGVAEAPWYFIAHSIPCPMAKQSTYVQGLRRTMELVCARLGKTGAQLAYSSRSGRPSDPWLTPDVNDVVRDEAARGHKDILFVTIGFIADHVEVLFDQDVEARDTAAAAGIRFHRSQTVGEHPLFVRMMADVVQKRMRAPEREAQRKSSVGAELKVCFCRPGEDNPPCERLKAVAHG